MDEREMMHGVDWSGEDLAGWYLSEKKDGARAYWDGAKLWSRGGIACPCPERWREELPHYALDCELWAGPDGRYLAGAAIKTSKGIDQMRLVAFDAPTLPGDWPERMQRVEDTWNCGLPCSSWLVVYWRECESTADALEVLATIKAEGGEGLVMRRPGLIYSPGRTHGMLKVKSPTPILYR